MKVLVFGGNGLVGSSICRSLVAKGHQVVSCSRSGKPFKTPSGYTPPWVEKIEWRQGTPFDESTYANLLPSCSAVVSTLGILLENSYKSGGVVDPLGVIKGVARSLLGDRGNPLRSRKNDTPTYERLNRDAAVAAFRAFSATQPLTKSASPSPFIFISAEDIFRPMIPERYIQTKRQAEQIISSEVALKGAASEGLRRIRPVFVRPSLIYHPHINPMSTIPATLIDASSRLQSKLPHSFRISQHFRATDELPGAFASSALSSMASLATIPPIHVDTIGEAVRRAVEDDSISGVLDVKRMRKMQGFDDDFDLDVGGGAKESSRASI
ncbi:NAD(P)-binding protein [Meredithblackwellia eburnea MCA 4105]